MERRIAGAILLLMLLAGASCAQGIPIGQIVQGVKPEKPSYELGESVPIEFTINNNTNQTITYSFPSSKQYDLWVTRGGDQEVYRMSAARVYSQSGTSMTLQPGDKRTFCTSWNQKDNAGRACGPGTYIICAQLTPSGRGPDVTTGRVYLGRRPALVPLTVKEAVSGFNSFSGRRVQITGTYKGFSPNPGDENTKQGPPVGKSDWAICDTTGCIYVVGTSTFNPTKDPGVSVTATGKLQKDAKGQVYLMMETAAATSSTGTCPPRTMPSK